MICDTCIYFNHRFEKTNSSLLKEVKECEELNMKNSLSFKVGMISESMDNCSYYEKINNRHYVCGDAGFDCVWDNDVCVNLYHNGAFTL